MKFIKTYEEHKQLSLFPDKDKAQDIAKTFINKYKNQSKEENYWQKYHVKKDITAKEIINKYNNRDKYNEIYRNYIHNDIDSNNYDFEYCAIQYFTENQNILISYFEQDDSQYGSYFDNIPDEERLEKLKEYLNSGYVDIDDIVNEQIILDQSNFIDFIKDNYWEYFDYYTNINSEYWDEIIDVLENSVDDKIPVYRSILVAKNLEELEEEMEQHSGVGPFWTHNEENAQPYCGTYNNSQEIILKAFVHVSYVNWDITFERSLYNLKEEEEIYIYKNSEVELFAIYLCDKSAEIMKNINFDYFADTYNFNDVDMRKIENFYKSDIKDKSTLIFDPPIKIKT
ncbi:hypothetical protein M0Q97_11410 [Candidatus Dojkabacteria bacterium]|jgi:hypothetical protein|nr:hypothetical protein [Candidatus Dojkabacteria bacterium]